MAKELMNDAERFLVERWSEARLLEENMETVRTKYKELFERVIDAVTEGHDELDASAAYPTQFWGSGYVGFGRKSWPGGDSKWPSGLWIENLRLEILAAEDTEPPYGYLWFSHKSKCALDLNRARLAVKKAAKELFPPQELNEMEDADSGGTSLLFTPAPSKSDLLRSLCDGDAQSFVQLFVSQFDMMARFIPVLDTVFREFVTKE